MNSAAMSDSDKVIVDTNVILDVTGADPAWLEWSREQMSRFPAFPLSQRDSLPQPGVADEGGYPG